ncbi:MAG: hypothetical protein ABI706_07130 [Ilumatobacteraceae bacterium]
MRIERSSNTVSWVSSDLMEGMGKMATRVKMAHDHRAPRDALGSDVPAALGHHREMGRSE